MFCSSFIPHGARSSRFLFAIFFAYLLEAPVSRFEKWFRGSRGIAILAVYLIFIALVTVIFVVAGPPVIDEAQKLVKQAPALAENISSGNLAKQLGSQHGWNEKTIEEFTHTMNAHKANWWLQARDSYSAL